MIDYETMKLMHRHVDEWVPMTEAGHHGSAEHDPERSWLRHAKIFRCSRCAEEIAIASPGHENQQVEVR